MKRRIYKKWLKNPMNKRLKGKHCNKIAYFKPTETRCLCDAIDEIERMIYERVMIPKEVFVSKFCSTSGMSARLQEKIDELNKKYKKYEQEKEQK